MELLFSEVTLFGLLTTTAGVFDDADTEFDPLFVAAAAAAAAAAVTVAVTVVAGVPCDD